jgi:hypothetical protein
MARRRPLPKIAVTRREELHIIVNLPRAIGAAGEYDVEELPLVRAADGTTIRIEIRRPRQ